MLRVLMTTHIIIEEGNDQEDKGLGQGGDKKKRPRSLSKLRGLFLSG